MKRLVFPLLAGLALITAGCSSDETVEVPKGQAIAFENTFVNKTGRATNLTQANDFKTLKVWGSSSLANSYIFDAQTLTTAGQTVTYTPPRYWDKNSTYHFMAIGSPLNTGAWSFEPGVVRGTDHTGAYGTLTFDNKIADGQEDLAYATADRTTGADVSSEASVALTFKHLLSRVRFTFTNTMPSGYSLEIKNVTIKDIPNGGTLYFDDPDNTGVATMVWQNTVAENEADRLQKVLELEKNTDVTQIVGNPDLYLIKTGTAIGTESFFTMPSAVAFTVHFEVNVYFAQDETDTPVCMNGDTPYTHDVTILAKIPATESAPEMTGLQMGYAYDFNAQIGPSNVNPGGLKPITFTVKVDPINPAGSSTVFTDNPSSTTEEGK